MNMVSKQKQEVVEPEAVHLAFCVDNRYFRSMGATLASVVAHNAHLRFVVHVFCFSISPEQQQRLDRLPAELGVSVRLHLVDPAVFREFERFTKSTYYSGAIFTRLLIPTVLSGQASRVLYLDADILCVGAIDELLAVELNDAIAAVVPDAEATAVRRHALLALKHPGYFNSGVMLMDIDRWTTEDISAKTIDAIIERGKDLRFPDQDALNIVLDGRAKFVDQKWNYLYGLVGDLERDKRRLTLRDSAVFIHFAGAVKPWSDWCLHESRDLFARYHAMSPWSDLPLDGVPRNYKEMRMHSRFLLRRRKVVESFYWYWKYTRAKFRF